MIRTGKLTKSIFKRYWNGQSMPICSPCLAGGYREYHIMKISSAVAPMLAIRCVFANIFRILPSEGNFFEAQNLCSRQGWTIPYDNGTSLENFMKSTNISSTWLYIRLQNMNMWRWVDGSEAPLYCDSCKGCAKITMTAGREKLIDEVGCAEMNMGFICQLKGPCENEPNLHCKRLGKKELLVGCSTKNWFTARATCRKHGGDLLIAKHMNPGAKRTLLNRVLPNVHCEDYRSEYFIGLTKYDLYGIGPKNERVEIDNTKWQDEQPSEYDKCIEIEVSINQSTQSGTGWRTKDCTMKNKIICQRNDVMKTTTTHMPSTSTAPAKEPEYKLETPREVLCFVCEYTVINEEIRGNKWCQKSLTSRKIKEESCVGYCYTKFYTYGPNTYRYSRGCMQNCISYISDKHYTKCCSTHLCNGGNLAYMINSWLTYILIALYLIAYS